MAGAYGPKVAAYMGVMGAYSPKVAPSRGEVAAPMQKCIMNNSNLNLLFDV